MPLYDLKCDRCGKEKKDHFTKFCDADKMISCECGGTMVKEVSSSNFYLKGSGWERDSYGS